MSESYKTVVLDEGTRIDFFSNTSFRVRYSTLGEEKFPKQYETPFCMSSEVKCEKNIICNVERICRSFKITTKEIVVYVKAEHRVIVEDLCGKRIYPKDVNAIGMFLDHCILFDSASFHYENSDCSKYSHWFYNEQTGNYDINLKEDKLYDLFFIYAKTYKEGYEEFNNIVGREPMLKKKSLGFFQTQHLGVYGTQPLLLKTAKLIRQRDIPCDTLVLDFEWGDGVDNGEEFLWGKRLAWNSNYCKPYSPKEMISKLKEDNFDVMLIHHSIPDYDNRTDEAWVNAPTESKIWWEKIKELYSQGVVGTWQDTRKTDVTNSIIYNGLQKIMGNERISFLANYELYQNCGWMVDDFSKPIYQRIGGRRTPFFWTGDLAFDKFSELEFQIRNIANKNGALKGISYLTNDGMIAGGRELGIRSMQFLCFNSIARSHNCKPWQGQVSADELNAKMAIDKDTDSAEAYASSEDYLLGLAFQDLEMQRIIKKFLKIRYSIIPYIYSYAYQTYAYGLPITRPLMIEYEDDYKCNNNQYDLEYLFGKEILVAPIFNSNGKREVYLPEKDVWIDYFSNKKHKGGLIEVGASNLETMPIFIKAGAIIPKSNSTSHVNVGQEEQLLLDVYPRGKSEFILYEDDGESLGYKDGEFSLTKITYDEKSKILQIGKASGVFKNQFSERELTVTIKGKKDKKYSFIVKTFEDNIFELY